MNITRQQRRANERRANKPEPAFIERTSKTRHNLKTKGMPFSRMKLVDIIPADSGKPAKFIVVGLTSNRGQTVTAKPNNIDWFVRGITPEMRMALLGM